MCHEQPTRQVAFRETLAYQWVMEDVLGHWSPSYVPCYFLPEDFEEVLPSSCVGHEETLREYCGPSHEPGNSVRSSPSAEALSRRTPWSVGALAPATLAPRETSDVNTHANHRIVTHICFLAIVLAIVTVVTATTLA